MHTVGKTDAAVPQKWRASADSLPLFVNPDRRGMLRPIPQVAGREMGEVMPATANFARVVATVQEVVNVKNAGVKEGHDVANPAVDPPECNTAPAGPVRGATADGRRPGHDKAGAITPAVTRISPAAGRAG